MTTNAVTRAYEGGLETTGSWVSPSRGSRGHFRPHTRGRGHETPPPNDSFKASLSPPVGGLLCSLRRDWQINECSNNVLNILPCF